MSLTVPTLDDVLSKRDCAKSKMEKNGMEDVRHARRVLEALARSST